MKSPSKHIIITCLFILSAFFVGCSSTERQTLQSQRPVRYYDSSFPDQNVSLQIADIFKSIKRIRSTVFYTTYEFSPAQRITRAQLDTLDLKKCAKRRVKFNQSTAGTAIAISTTPNHVTFLTCAHTLTFPERLIQYLSKKNIPEKTFILSVSVKERQQNTIFNLPLLGAFEVLAIDNARDLALLSLPIKNGQVDIPAFDYPLGQPEALQWGAFVYIIGFPKGFPMVTRAIVSDPNRDSYHSFIMDALFNQGISGGIILAIRGGAPNFEWVGMANTTAAHQEYILSPHPDKAATYPPYVPYSDSIYVESRTHIEYGITQSISMDKIRSFIRENADRFKRGDFDRVKYYLD